MGHRLSKIYTRTGDKGTTGLADGSRVSKNDLRIECLGTIDELSASIGVVLCDPTLRDPLKTCFTQVQNDLFDLGGELAIPGTETLTVKYTEYLEQQLDALNDELDYLKEFILPGGHIAAAQTHVARTICRRAERNLFTLSQEHPLNVHSQMYINRLSDLLFVAARIINKDNNIQEPYWERRKEK